MDWIEEGYRLLWAVVAPLTKEMANVPSSAEHRDFVSGAIAEMLAGNAVTLLPPCERPWVVSPLGVVRKPRTNKFGLAVNMRYVNRHVGNKAFKFEGLKDLADLAEKGDYAVSYDLMSGYYHVGLHPKIQNLRRIQMGGEVLRLQLPPIRAFYSPVGFLEGNGRACYVLEEGKHKGASLPRRLYVYET
jgi:hypothetical protein